MSTIPSSLNLTPEESAKVAALLRELHEHGYQDVNQHGWLCPGVRIRHIGHQWMDAYVDGSGFVVAVAEKPDSSWSRSYNVPDIELIAVWDKPGLGGRVSQVAQYHVKVIRR